MQDYIIMTDSCCDLTDQMARELELEVLPLSEEKHREAHTMSDAEFFDKYHLPGGIVMDKTLCRIYGLKANRGKRHGD